MATSTTEPKQKEPKQPACSKAKAEAIDAEANEAEATHERRTLASKRNTVASRGATPGAETRMSISAVVFDFAFYLIKVA